MGDGQPPPPGLLRQPPQTGREPTPSLSERANTTALKDTVVSVKPKLAALWVAVMVSYIYNDFFSLFWPGELEHVIDGYMGPFLTSQTSVLSAMILMTIPTLMIFLSLVLPARANRWTNIILGILYTLVAIPNVIGESRGFYLVGNAVQAVFLILIVRYAWTWPVEPRSASTTSTSPSPTSRTSSST